MHHFAVRNSLRQLIALNSFGRHCRNEMAHSICGHLASLHPFIQKTSSRIFPCGQAVRGGVQDGGQAGGKAGRRASRLSKNSDATISLSTNLLSCHQAVRGGAQDGRQTGGKTCRRTCGPRHGAAAVRACHRARPTAAAQPRRRARRRLPVPHAVRRICYPVFAVVFAFC